MVAIVVAMLLESKPIYESLTRRMIEQQTAANKKTQVTHESPTPESDIQPNSAL